MNPKKAKRRRRVVASWTRTIRTSRNRSGRKTTRRIGGSAGKSRRSNRGVDLADFSRWACPARPTAPLVLGPHPSPLPDADARFARVECVVASGRGDRSRRKKNARYLASEVPSVKDGGAPLVPCEGGIGQTQKRQVGDGGSGGFSGLSCRSDPVLATGPA